MTPEERRQWMEGATSVLSIAAALGGPKTKAAATLATVGVGAAVRVADVADTAGLPTEAITRAAAEGSGQDAAASVVEAPLEVLTLEVVATAESGGLMHVYVEGIGAFEVNVPAHVRRGESFEMQIEAPLERDCMQPEAVPMGMPVGVVPPPLLLHQVEVPIAVPLGGGPSVGGGAGLQ